MKAQVKLYRKFKDANEFETFIKQCELSGCYPWNITTLKIMLNQQSRARPRYPYNQPLYDCSWTITDKTSAQVQAWRAWMALKHDITIESYTEVEFTDGELNV